MVSSAKLAVISETEEGALIEHCLVFQHLFYILIEKEPSRLYYIAPINFLENHYIPHVCLILMVFKKPCEINGG